jgi:hypothetical protein
MSQQQKAARFGQSALPAKTPEAVSSAQRQQLVCWHSWLQTQSGKIRPVTQFPQYLQA